MGKFWLVLILLILLASGGGVGYLMTVDINPPTEHVEKTLPDDNFPK